MILRLTLCSLIAAVSLYIGYYLTDRMDKRRRLLADFIRIFGEVSDRIAYTSDNLAEAFNKCSDDFDFSPEKPFDSQWNDMLKTRKAILRPDDMKLLTDFLNGLGSYDEDQRRRHFELYIASLKKRLDEAEKEIKEKSDVTRIVPFAAGTVLAIILL